MERLRGSDLVAASAAPGPAWLDLLAAAWEAGAAVLPVDHRLPTADAERLIDRARPTALAANDGLQRLADGVPVEDGVRLVMPTSGTSAEPKLVELAEDAITAALDASTERIGVLRDEPWLCCLPVAHMGGMLVLLRAVVRGVPVVVQPSFDVDAVASAVAAGVRYASVVPTMLVRLLDAEVDLGTLRAILVGGTGMDPSLRTRAEAAGANVVRTYGLTESCGGVVYEGVPLDGVEVRVAPPPTPAPTPTPALATAAATAVAPAAQVSLRGATLMRRYRFDPEATAAAFDGDGWFGTSDAGTFHDGRLTILGRIDDAILTGGETVWPERVEAALRTHARVADVAVSGAPDREWGERVVAYVVPADPTAPPTLEALREHAGRTLLRHEAPWEVVLLDRLPRTASGKLQRARLDGEAASGSSAHPR